MKTFSVQSYLFLASTIIFTLTSQILLKWQVSVAGALPESLVARASYLISLLFNPWVVLAVAATFIAGVSWILTISKIELSYAYPCMSLLFPLMMAAGAVLFNEPVTGKDIFGAGLIILGVGFIGAARS